MNKKADVEEVEIDMSKPAPNKRKVTSDTFWHDKDGNLVIMQMPNKFLIGWFGFFLLSELIHTQPFRIILSWIAFALIITWAILEMRSGVNYFRKSLGLLIFLFAILTKF
jgi:hypothetical protein